ncbi:MAG TPA: tetratricopeptide repeat protein [Terriglobales bacterium]|nr:tetratricopeptide repeat protein [Terriglobales bacterium]
MRRSLCILGLMFAFPVASLAHHVKQAAVKTMPVTTSSAKARDLYIRAMKDYENYYLERANVGWRAATKEDPDFALAYAWLAFNSRNPSEVNAALSKAHSLEPKVTPGERLMIEWIVNVLQNNFIAGISAMNDMLAVFPHDKQLLYLAGNWMMGQSSDEHAQSLFERALALDQNYPAALNDLAYSFARQRQFDKALATMERYTAALPGQPNPQDSYAELLRMSGQFQQALDHYRAALKIDPDFISSQVGLGDTYALMGNQAQARIEYDKAIQQATNDADHLDYELQKGISYVRENNFAEADKTFLAAATRAHALGLHLGEAKAQRMMGMYGTDYDAARKHLQLAQDALTHEGNLTPSEREEERAKILRIGVVRATQSGDQELAAKSLQQLEEMTNASSSRNIRNAWHGAAGAAFVSQKKFADAIAHLEEDSNNPCSLALLAQAYAATESTERLHQIEARLAATYLPTLEQALAVSSMKGHIVAGK